MSTGYVKVPNYGSGGGGVESVTGSVVDNTDPANPVINAGDGTLDSTNFNTVHEQQAYTVAALSGKTIVQVTIGPAIVAVGNYGLVGTTLTFTGFTVQGVSRCVVLYKDS